MELRREDFINQYPPLNVMNKEAVERIWDRESIHLYIHIPFCPQKCDFCYYKTLDKMRREDIEDYIKLLKKEIEIYSSLPELQDKVVRSLYMGGGTPTILTSAQLTELIVLIKRSFNFTDDFEFCCEARPGNELSLEKLETLRKLGIRRLSIGCQSLDDAVLSVNKRCNNVDDFYKAFERARNANIPFINVDLISGMVEQSFESWMDTIDGICRLRPENIAIYKLELYYNNELYRRYRKNGIELISDAEEAHYIRNAYNRLIASGYILADHFSFLTDWSFDHIHRRGTWKGEDMLGIGLSSHSYFAGYLYQNTSDIEVYRKSIMSNTLPIHRAYRIPKKEEMIRTIVFGIKNLSISRKEFYNKYGIDILDVFGNYFEKLEQGNFINIDEQNIEVTLEGAIYADDIARAIYPEEHKNLMLGHMRRKKE